MKKGAREMKVQRANVYITDGTVVKVRPLNGKKFDYKELQQAVGGSIESLISGIKGCRQMFCNEEGIMLRLPDNPHTWNVVNAGIYRLNGYTADWRLSGNIIAIFNEEDDHIQLALPTTAFMRKS
jgi:hypothetical protein